MEKDAVILFLRDLEQKLDTFGLIIIDRHKNLETLSELELVKSDIKKYIKELTYRNYFRGPAEDTENEGEYWEFGTMIKGREIYIKINYGKMNKAVICISFHFAEFKIKYLFN